MVMVGKSRLDSEITGRSRNKLPRQRHQLEHNCKNSEIEPHRKKCF